MKNTKGLSYIVSAVLVLLMTMLGFVALEFWYTDFTSLQSAKLVEYDTSYLQIVDLQHNALFVYNDGDAVSSINITLGSNQCIYNTSLATGITQINVSDCVSYNQTQEVVVRTSAGVLSSTEYADAYISKGNEHVSSCLNYYERGYRISGRYKVSSPQGSLEVRTCDMSSSPIN